jgi:hypothetical protein
MGYILSWTDVEAGFCTMPFISLGRLRDKMPVTYKRAINIGSDGHPSRDNYPDPASRVRHVSN